MDMFDAASRYKFKISHSNDMGLNAHVIDECLGSLIDEAESIKPSQIDLSSFRVCHTLEPKIWVNGLMNSRVRLRLLDIADDFVDYLNVTWCKPIDTVVTGSIANYNWSRYSDIDLHIIYDFKEVDERTEFVREYFDTKRKQWNDKHGSINIYGHTVELYVQDINEYHVSTGIYSLEENEWIVKPHKDNIESVKLNKGIIKDKVASIASKIFELEEKSSSIKDEHEMDVLSKKVRTLFTKIRGMRKESLNRYGEWGTGNIIYKALRRLGYIDRLINLRDNTYNKLRSIEK